MLREIVQLIAKAQTTAADGTLFCHGLLIDDEAKKCIEFLEDQVIVENTNYENKLGQTISLELSLPKLNAVGYYHQKADLIRKHKYTYPPDLFYIEELNQFSDAASVPFYAGFALIQHFISAIKSIAKHNYTDVDTEYALIANDDKAVLLPLTYGVHQIDGLSSQNIDHIQSCISVFEDSNTEKKIIFIN
jgi:hypothetical protein